MNGPLELIASDCQADVAKHEGKTIARMYSCLRLYQYEAGSETDVLRDHGVGWIQTTVDAVHGWCAARVQSRLIVPDSLELHSSAPRHKLEPTRRERATVTVKTDAQGNGLETGSVSQSFDVFPQSLKPKVVDDRKVLTKWEGRESARLAFALGAEVSWGLDASPSIIGGLGKMSFVKAKGC
ncbi:MAG: hypothetical protein M3198_06510 [Actinomycetota bacterium]|nr:hypothetical protein [Actinomycetota bacterium]